MNIQDLPLDSMTPILVALLAGGGIWKYLGQRHKIDQETKIRDPQSTKDFQDNLLDRVNIISVENKELYQRVDELKDKLMSVSVELSGSKEKIKHLENEILLYELRKKAENMPLF